MAAPLESRRERAIRAVVTLGLLAANLLVFNVLLASWAGARVDLTRDRIYSVSPATQRLLASLDDDLYIYCYFSKRTHPKLAPLEPQIEDLLDEYRALAHHHLHVEVLDPGENDQVEKEANDRFGVRSTPFRLASKYESGIVNAYFAVVVKYGDQYVRYGFEDLIDVEPLPDGDVDVHLRNLEYDLTRAIRKVVYGFRGGGRLFERVGKPVTLTAVITPDELPAVFKDVPDAIRKAAQQLKESGKEHFTFQEIHPTTAEQQDDVAQRFGARPVSMGLFSSRGFYLGAYLTVGDEVEPLPLSGENVTPATIREAVESALKRRAPGFLKTVGVVTPAPGLPPEVLRQMQMRGQMANQPPPEFDQVKQALRQNYNVRDVSLDAPDGVPADVDVMLVLKPKNLGERAVYNLDQYLMRGGKVIVCAGSFDPEFSQSGLMVRPLDSGLDAWLKHDGVEISKTLLLDDVNQPLPIPQVRQTVFGPIRTWVMRPYPYLVQVQGKGLENRAIAGKIDAVGIYWGSPVEVDSATVGKLQVTPILSSSDRSWTDDDLSRVAHVDYTVPPGTKPHDVAIALQGRFDSFYSGKDAPPVPGDSTGRAVPLAHSPETRLVVIGDAEFVSDLVARALGRQQGDLYMQNLGFIQNLIDWMNLDNDLVSIRARSATARPIARLSRKADIAIELANYLVPLLVLMLVGLGRYWRRRRVAPHVGPAAPLAGAPGGGGLR